MVPAARAAAYTSSPLVFGGRVYAVNDTGVLTVFDAKTGREIYKARVGGVGNTFSASPWALGGKIYFLERGRGHLRHQPRRHLRRGREEQPRRDVASRRRRSRATACSCGTATSLYRIR